MSTLEPIPELLDGFHSPVPSSHPYHRVMAVYYQKLHHQISNWTGYDYCSLAVLAILLIDLVSLYS